MGVTARKPVLQVIGPSGRDLAAGWGSALLGVSVTDAAGHESDECEIRMRWTPPFDSRPPKGTKYTVSVGWADEGMTTLGVYTVQKTRRSGNPDEGEMLTITCRAADMLDKAKASGTKHYDKETGHGTAGKIFEDVAKEAGVSAVVDPSIASIEIPYRLRWQQSSIDFVSELADEIGAVVKPQAGKLVVTTRGGGASGSGGELPPIVIHYDDTYDYEVEEEPRGDYKAVNAPYFDAQAGRSEIEAFETSSPASVAGLTHPAPSKDEAKRQGGAAADAYARSSATGSFEAAGDGLGVAGAPVICIGFGEDIDSVDWRASTVTHEIVPDQGWRMTVATEVKDKTKGASKTS